MSLKGAVGNGTRPRDRRPDTDAGTAIADTPMLDPTLTARASAELATTTVESPTALALVTAMPAAMPRHPAHSANGPPAQPQDVAAGDVISVVIGSVSWGGDDRVTGIVIRPSVSVLVPGGPQSEQIHLLTRPGSNPTTVAIGARRPNPAAVGEWRWVSKVVDLGTDVGGSMPEWLCKEHSTARRAAHAIHRAGVAIGADQRTRQQRQRRDRRQRQRRRQQRGQRQRDRHC